MAALAVRSVAFGCRRHLGVGADCGLLRRLGGVGTVSDHGGGNDVLGEHDPLVAEHVVGVEFARADDLHARDVAEAQGRRGVVTTDDHEGRAGDAEGVERHLGGLGLRRVDAPAVDDDDLALVGPVGQGRLERQLHHLLRGLLVVLAGLRPEGDATTAEVRSADRALASVAGALLGVGLAAATAHFGAGLGALRAGAAGGELGRDDLVHHRDVGLDAEHVVVDLDGAGVLAGHVLERESCHVQPFFPFSGPAIFTALRTMTTPPAGPGTEPLINSRLRSTSDWTTSRFCVVTCS